MGTFTPESGSSGFSELSNTLRILHFSNAFPTEDLATILRRFHLLAKSKEYPVLANFLEESTRAVHKEVAKLPHKLKVLVPCFESIIALSECHELRAGPLNGSIDGVLLCVLQLAAYIWFCENSQSDFEHTPASDNVLTGLGIGLLATTAVSLSPDVPTLADAGAQVVRVAFRLGVHVYRVSQNLEPSSSDGSLDSWAYVVSGVTGEKVQKELDGFQRSDSTPRTSKIFISAMSPTSTTISGPPSKLKNLFKTSSFFREQKSVMLPVFGGLCHASHVFGPQDVRSVVGHSSNSLTHLPRTPILATSTGQSFGMCTAEKLLVEVVSEIMTGQIVWDNVIAGVVDLANKAAATDAQVMIFQRCLPSQDLQKALKDSLPHCKIDATEILSGFSSERDQRSNPRSSMQSKIAVVGISCRMPGGATDTEAFWDLLERGLDVHKKIPADRFDADSHCDPTGKRMNTSATPYGCFIDEPGLFDASFFNMSPREVEQTDPMQRLALVTAAEALERAGVVSGRTTSTQRQKIGTWYGQASDDYREVNTAQEISTYFIPGGCRAFGPGRINYFFKFAGPSFSCDTACSSSLATIQAACTALQAGDVDTVVAGGLNVLTNSDAFAGLCNGHFLTKTANACKTWDCDADGYCRADAIGSIVMKRLEDAEADNDNILGVVLAAATNHSADAISITHPHAGHQADLTRQVLTRAGVDPLDISYVELHGTGTTAGDSEEVQSVTNVFAPLAGPRRRTAKQPLYIGAVKSNVGHSEAAAGVTALIKVLLMLQKCAIPPHVGIKTNWSPKLPQDLKQRHVFVPYQKTEWQCPATGGRRRIAAVNNFSAAGGNTTLLIEEAPVRVMTAVDPRPSHIVAISAKSKVSLRGNVERMLAFVSRATTVSMANLAYTTTARKNHYNHRLAFHCSDTKALAHQLNETLATVDQHRAIPAAGSPSIAFTFTGQGASDKSMNMELFHESPAFRAQILDLDALAVNQGFPSIIPAIDGRHAKDYSGHSAVVTQITLCCIEIALARLWALYGVQPDVVVGHSLGEYAALCVAGVLSASDAIYLVGVRASLLQLRCTPGSHKMLAVKAALSDIEPVTSHLDIEVACVNAPKATVLSGTQDQIGRAEEVLTAAEHRCVMLDVPFAFHSAQTDPVLEDFESIADREVLFREPVLPVISPLLGKVVFDKTINAKYLRRATRETVDFLTAMEKAYSMSIVDDSTAWVELGPHPVCCGFIKASFPSTKVVVGSLRRGENNWTSLVQSMGKLHCAGVEINWHDYHHPFESSLTLLDLPTYCWNEKNYWIQYKGDWALTKGNTFYDAEKGLSGQPVLERPSASRPKTATVQKVIEEDIDSNVGSARIVIRSDLMQPDFLAAAHGHRMNGCGVVTSSIHADIAFTLGERVLNGILPGSKLGMNITNLEVSRGLVANKNTGTPQWIQVTASSNGIASGVHLVWQNVDLDGKTGVEPFATADLVYGDTQDWLDSWGPLEHLIRGRVEALDDMARNGVANRFSHSMAYTLFANNLVDYATKYRGMQAVILSGFEAYAEVTLTTQEVAAGTWTVPPYFIDSVAHLAGFVMNVSDESDVSKTFCVTPGWRSMRFARPLTAGKQYQSYVKMIATAEDPSVYLGDVYILQEGTIIGTVGGIKFRRYPRILLDRFFSTPDAPGRVTHATASPAAATAVSNRSTKIPGPQAQAVEVKVATRQIEPKVEQTPVTVAKVAANSTQTSAGSDAASNSISGKALEIISAETGLEVDILTDEASFGDLGVDSLMSLVISEKLRQQLNIAASSSVFLDYPTIGSLRTWLEECYN